MKRFMITTIVALFFSVLAMAGHSNSSFVLRMFDNSKFKIKLDNRAYGGFDRAVRIDGVTPGKHYLKITRKGHGYYRSHQVIFRGYVTIRPNQEIFAVLTPSRRIKVEHFHNTAPEYGFDGNCPSPFHDNYIDEHEIGGYTFYIDEGYGNNGYCGTNGHDHYVEDTYDGYGNDNYGNDYYGNDNYYYDDTPNYGGGSCGGDNYAPPVAHAVGPNQFDEILYTIKSQSFDSSKREMMRYALNNHLFTTKQVKRMLKQFSYDSSKLEMAKAAYHRTVDRERYHIVFDVFSFDSSRRKLIRYIEKNG